MTSSSSPVRDAMLSVLREAGFRVQSNTWHKSCQDTLLVVNLQKSQWGPQYYINLAVWVRQLGEALKPKEYQCHIRERATSLPSEEAKRLERALDLADESLSPEERAACIAGFIKETALPFLDSLSTLEGIRSAFESQKLKGCFVHRQLKELLAAQA
jgi:Domain of unknown function (DUF4304)